MTLHRWANDETLLAFPTPILYRRIPETEAVNNRLREIILERRSRDTGIQKSNVGGWHSRDDLLEWDYPEIKTLSGWIVEAVKSMTIFTTGVEKVSGELDAWAWANVSGHGDYHKPHVHPDAMWSGTYYVDIGSYPAEDPDSGLLEFVDPRAGVEVVKLPGVPFSTRVRIRPEAGRIVMFPAWIYHYVNAYKGEDVRISIAFNVRITETSLPARPTET